MVTLGIIGVVSAMTLPTLVKNHQRQVYVTQLHKFYNEFQQALDSEINSKNAINLLEAGFRNNNSLENFFKSNFKVVKDCASSSGCFASSYNGLIDEGATLEPDDFGFAWYRVVISSGASIGVSFYNATDPNNEVIAQMIVDTNGTQGPNIVGRDFFRMYIYADGVIDEHMLTPNCRQIGGSEYCDGEDSPQALRERAYPSCGSALDADGCLGRLINDGWKMEY